MIPLGIRVTLLTDGFCVPALRAGLEVCGFHDRCRIIGLPAHPIAASWNGAEWRAWLDREVGTATHLLALERVGPSHTLASVADVHRSLFAAEVPEHHRNCCQTMRGRDITASMSPVHVLFEEFLRSEVTTIGIGDGGNEIGMGRLPWSLLQKNIPRGGLIACRTATRHLIVAGISNWGAYGLATGICHLRGEDFVAFCNIDLERRILDSMVAAGLVDGVSGCRSASVDGLSFADYASLLADVAKIDSITDRNSSGPSR